MEKDELSQKQRRNSTSKAELYGHHAQVPQYWDSTSLIVTRQATKQHVVPTVREILGKSWGGFYTQGCTGQMML